MPFRYQETLARALTLSSARGEDGFTRSIEAGARAAGNAGMARNMRAAGG
jgi:hypothetical protein